MIEVVGKITFDPVSVSKKHKEQNWKSVAMITTGCDMADYYAWYIKIRYGLPLNKPLRGTHVTFISDIMNRDIFEEGKKVFDNKEIIFKFDPANIRSNSNHWWINVICPDADSIREALGIGKPYFGYHLTLGYANEINYAHSEYIHKTILKLK